MQKAYILFVIAVAGMGVASGIHDTSFNNYLSEIFAINACVRGMLEFPREAPGLLAVLIAGALIGFGQVKMAVISLSLLAIGLFGLGLFSSSFSIMVFWLVIWSTGNHLFMPLEGSIAVSLAKDEGIGHILGRIGSIRIGTTLVGAAIIWLGMGRFELTFRHTYVIAAVFALIGVAALLQMPAIKVQGKQGKLVWKSQYKVFYWLCILWGIRKQIFITFAPWLLVDTFGQPASGIAQLWILTSLLGIFFRPLLGSLSDKLGERVLFLAEVPLVMAVFVGYALAPHLVNSQLGLYLVYGCYIIDAVMMGMPIVRTSYVSKILLEKNDLPPTLAMGVSLDHVSSMVMPIIGGLLWAGYGSSYLFSFAGLVLLANGFLAYYAIPRFTGPQTNISA